MGVRPAEGGESRGAIRPGGSGNTAPPGLAARRTAVSLLRQVLERGQPLDALLDETHGSPHFRALPSRDRALVHAIVATVLRRRGDIDAALTRCLNRSLPPNSEALAAILRVGAAQILYLDVPDHAAVDLAVTQAAGDRRTGRARGLVNGVMRRLARERDAILTRDHAGGANTPDWLRSRWESAYGGETARAIAEAHLQQPGLDISVKGDPADWAARLGGTALPTGTVRLLNPGRVSALAGFDEGAWWVQDAAAAIPARLLGGVAGQRVADLCAAPGGKTAQLAAAGAEVTAVDVSATRLKRLAANLKRLQLDARLQAADVLAWEPSQDFDAVLLDAPCSATGTIRRHPDIPWLKRPEDISALASLQERMLGRAASLVRPGGVVVLATCSLEPEEGERQVAPFLAEHPNFALEPIRPDEVAGLRHLLTPAGLLRTLPSHGFGPENANSGMDGFFAARFQRTG